MTNSERRNDMRKIGFTVILTLLCIALSSGAVWAGWSFTNQDNGYDWASNHQVFNRIVSSSAGLFEAPWKDSFTTGTWTVTGGASYINAVSTTLINTLNTGDLSWKTYFGTDPSTPITYSYWVYKDNNFLFGAKMDWNGSGMSWSQPTSAPPVPIPAAAWLLGSGLLGLVAIRRKFKK
jgi:hypothetical protein